VGTPLTWQTDDRAGQVHVVTEDEALSGAYTLADVVLPIPGSRVCLPENAAGRFALRLLDEEGLAEALRTGSAQTYVPQNGTPTVQHTSSGLKVWFGDLLYMVPLLSAVHSTMSSRGTIAGSLCVRRTFGGLLSLSLPLPPFPFSPSPPFFAKQEGEMPLRCTGKSARMSATRISTSPTGPGLRRRRALPAKSIRVLAPRCMPRSRLPVQARE